MYLNNYFSITLIENIALRILNYTSHTLWILFQTLIMPSDNFTSRDSYSLKMAI